MGWELSWRIQIASCPGRVRFNASTTSPLAGTPGHGERGKPAPEPRREQVPGSVLRKHRAALLYGRYAVLVPSIGKASSSAHSRKRNGSVWVVFPWGISATP